MTPYKPTQLSRGEVEVLQELIFSKRLFPLSANSSEKMRFVSPAAISPETAPHQLLLKAAQEKIHLALRPTAESSFAQRLAEFGGSEAIPKDFAKAVTAFCSREIIQAIENFLQVPMALCDERENASELAPHPLLAFEIINQEALVQIQGEIQLPRVLLDKLVAMARKLPAAERADLGACALQGELLIGSATIPSSQWNTVQAGALIFFQAPSTCVTGQGFFHLQNGPSFPLTLEIKELQALMRPLKEVALSGFAALGLDALKKNSSARKQDAASLERPVDIELTFSAATLSLTVEEILKLSQNKKLTGPLQMNHSIKILAQGKFLGMGELVELHGQHAVFVTQLLTER